MKRVGKIYYDKQTHSIKGLHTPVFLDLTQDRVRLRLLTMFLFLFILSIAAFQAISALFYQRSVVDDENPDTMTFTKFPDSEVYYNTPFTNVPNTRISNMFEIGLESKTVSISATYDPAIPFQSNQNGKTLIQIRDQEIYPVSFQGTTQSKTDEDGFTDFSSLQLNYGPIGAVVLNYSCESVWTTFTVYTKTNVSIINTTDLPPYSESGNSTEEFGVPLTVQPEVRIFDSEGNPLAGHYVRIYNNPNQFATSLYYQRFALFEGEVAGPSDENGTIKFTDFTVIGATTKDLYFAFFSERDPIMDPNVINWVYYTNNQTGIGTYGQPVIFSTDVSNVEIIIQPSENVTEGVPFSPQPKIRVTNSGGEGIPNKIVFARFKKKMGEIVSDVSELDNEYVKNLLNVISGKTDAQGEVQFENLTVGVEGTSNNTEDNSTAYTLSFICDGVESEESTNFWILSSVTKMVWLQNSTESSLLDGWQYSEKQNLSDLYGMFTPSPMLRVTDKDENPVAGKFAWILALPEDGNISSIDDMSEIRVDGKYSVSDLDGIISFPYLRIVSLYNSSKTRLKLVAYCDELIVESDWINITLGNSSTTRCSQLYFKSGNFTDYLSKPFHVGVDEPFNMTVKVLDFRGRPLANQTIRTGTQLFVETFDNFVPTSFMFPLEADNVTDEYGEANFTNVFFSGYTGAGYFFVYALNLEESYHWKTSNVEFDCLTEFTVHLTNNIQNIVVQVPETHVEIAKGFSQPIIVQVNDSDPNQKGEYYVDVITMEFPLYLIYAWITISIGPSEDLITPDNQFNVPGDMKFYRNPVKVNCSDTGTLNITDLQLLYPGEYSLILRVGGVFTHVLPTIIAYAPVEIIAITIPPNDSSQPVISGKIFDQQPEVYILNSTGGGVPNVFVVAETNETGSLYTDNIYTVAVSSKSDSAGKATFTNLRFRSVTEPGTYIICFSFYNSSDLTSPMIRNCSNQGINATTLVDHITLTGLPSAASPGVIFYTSPVVTVFDVNSSPLSGALVMAKFSSKPAGSGDKTIDLYMENYFGETDVTGRVILDSMYFYTNVSLGVYEIVFTCDGINSNIMEIELTNTVDKLEILIQPSPNITIGIPFPATSDFYVGSEVIGGQVAVQAFIKSGAPLPYKGITAVVGENAAKGNFALDVSRSVETTDGYGIAKFELKAIAGKPDYKYTIYFTSDGVQSKDTDSFSVFNPVAQVLIIEQPGIGSNDFVELDEKLPDQPLILVLDHDNKGMEHKTITVKTVQHGTISTSSGGPVSEPGGYYRFTDLKITSGSTQDYELIFIVDGIESQKSQKFNVHDPSSPDLSGFKKLKGLIILATLIMLFPFFGNSERQNRRWGMLLPFGVSIFILVLVGTIWGNSKDSLLKNGYVITSLIILTLVTLFSVGLLWFLIIVNLWADPNKWEFCPKRLKNYKNLVRRLLPIGSVRFFVLQRIREKFESDFKSEKLKWKEDQNEDDQKEKGKENEKEKKNQNEIELESDLDNKQNENNNNNNNNNNNENDDDIPIDSIRKKNFDDLNDQEISKLITNFINKDSEEKEEDNKTESALTRFGHKMKSVGGKVKSKISDLLASEENPHARFETKKDFFYPQRLFIAITLTSFIIFYMFLIFVKINSYIKYKVIIWRQEILELEARLQGFISQSKYSVENAFHTSFDLDLNFNSTSDFLPQNILRVVSFLGSVDNDKVDKYFEISLIAICVSSVLSAAVIGVLWYLIMKLYRQRIMRMRQGHKIFRQPMPPPAATSYSGIQGWLAGITFVLFVLIFLAIIVCLGFAPLRKFLWRHLWPILLGILLSVVIKAVIVALIKYFIARDGEIVHPRLFYLWDFIWLFLNIVSGLATAIIRLVVLMFANLAFFMRLDQPSLSGSLSILDSGHRSYVSVLQMDHKFNNPVVSLFIRGLTRGFKYRRQIQKGFLSKDGCCAKISKSELDIAMNFFKNDMEYLNALNKQKAALRILLLITLRNNPKVAKYRYFNVGKDDKFEKKIENEFEKLDKDVHGYLENLKKNSSSSDDDNNKENKEDNKENKEDNNDNNDNDDNDLQINEIDDQEK
ncbi:hypothetical protein M0811_06923 [Anaeramoeba ignava]|uniref:Uncharacterized protein n=1 Tax=Anaeramoeba ignava TaxID=1746090 RepID=A0A9Q0RD17_ANAIG|nr:hypothetical protein M0811_06923 [Anaeramoeba ignava]